MLTVTVDQFIKFGPCYGAKRIREIAGDKTEWSALDILDLSDIPPQDKLWAVLREQLIPAPILHEFACRCAEKALLLIPNPDPRSREAIRVKRAWLAGKATDKELAAARAAAWDAARAAARDAARAAAWAAARDAARATAWDAAKAAAWDAAEAAAGDAAKAAAWDAAEAAAWDAQVDELRSMLEEEADK